MAGRVNDEKAGQLERVLLELRDHLALLLYHGYRHVCRADLLRNSARLPVLVKKKGLKGRCNEMNNFFEGLKNQISTFCICTNGFYFFAS